MTKPPITQSQKRFNESLGALFTREDATRKLVFLKSSSDEGVVRNGGRNGARFAPASFLTAFKRLTQDPLTREWSFCEFEVANQSEEEQDFEAAQKAEAQRITDILAAHPDSAICHIGGGHDHVRPLLLALAVKAKKMVVINIDAHADTRTDDQGSSGTPFRQFAREYDGEFKLFEVGLHSYANSLSTLSQLEKGQMDVVWRKELLRPNIFEEIHKRLKEIVDQDTLVIFSLDADALSAAEVPGVSAVNADGLTRSELRKIWETYRKLAPHPSIFGIYELNPAYDNLSMLSMRTLSTFLFETLD